MSGYKKPQNLGTSLIYEYYLFQDLLTVIIQELVDSVCKEFVLSIEEVVHVDEHSPNVEVNI